MGFETAFKRATVVWCFTLKNKPMLEKHPLFNKDHRHASKVVLAPKDLDSIPYSPRFIAVYSRKITSQQMLKKFIKVYLASY